MEKYGCEYSCELFKDANEIISELLRALEMACDEIDVAKDIMSDCHLEDFAYTLNAEPDYFRARAREDMKNGKSRKI